VTAGAGGLGDLSSGLSWVTTIWLILKAPRYRLEMTLLR